MLLIPVSEILVPNILIQSLQVLAQASSGNAPSMPPLPTQKALTLEEIELQAATAAVRM